MNQKDRLKQWVESLEKDQLEKIAVECIQELILSEMISFWDTTKVPYWSHSGDTLDGTELQED